MESLDIARVPEDTRRRMGLDRLPVERATTSMADLTDLTGRAALVTGAGGSGLGNAIAHRLAELGALVVAVDIDEGRAQETVAELEERYGEGTAFAVAADATDWAELESAIATVEERTGGIDVLVANVGGSGGIAGTGPRVTTAESFTLSDKETIDRLVRVNLSGALYISTLVSRRMVERSRGRIILISSQNAAAAVAGVAVYSSCKAALQSLTRCLAAELGPAGVSTVCVSPGLMLGQAFLDVVSSPSPLTDVLVEGAERINLGRPGTFDDVAAVVAFLATDAASYVHGTTVAVAGGIGG